MFMASVSVEFYKSLDSTGHVFGDRVMLNTVPLPESTDGSVMRLMKGQSPVINPLPMTPVVIVPPLTDLPK